MEPRSGWDGEGGAWGSPHFLWKGWVVGGGLHSLVKEGEDASPALLATPFSMTYPFEKTFSGLGQKVVQWNAFLGWGWAETKLGPVESKVKRGCELTGLSLSWDWNIGEFAWTSQLAQRTRWHHTGLPALRQCPAHHDPGGGLSCWNLCALPRSMRL